MVSILSLTASFLLTLYSIIDEVRSCDFVCYSLECKLGDIACSDEDNIYIEMCRQLATESTSQHSQVI